MKTQIKIAALLVTLMVSPLSKANNLCMPDVLEFVMKDFDYSIQTTGLIVKDRQGVVLNLGKNIGQSSVVISDIHKNSYLINIPLNFIDHRVTNLVVRTTVMIENYTNCRITTTKPVYAVYEDN
jgi:hypothetical protein